MRYVLANKSGFILITILMFFVLLTVIVAVYLFVSTTELRQAGNNLADAKALALAEAGLERGIREIRDDVLTTTQVGIADLRGANTTGSVSVTNIARIIYIAEATGTATIDSNSDIAQLRTFDTNYTNTRIISVFLCARASRASGGTGATLRVSYTTDNVLWNIRLTQALTTTITEYSVDITSDRIWSWSTIMSSNFILRAVRTAGNRNINLDALYLRVTYEIDTNTENWATGGFATFPIALGDGRIDSISITAEQGKVHLNTASQSLLRYLMQERGIASATANTLATRIVNYRSSKYFDSVEELRGITGMTSAYYNLIRDFVTVYSFINTYAQRPTGNRAPININVAPREVLEAIFDPLNLGTNDPASLATNIINTRATTPFTCFYSSNAAVASDFYDFVLSQAYLNATERNRILDNADASLLVPVAGATGYNVVTTEFSYDTNAFTIDSVGVFREVPRRTVMIINDDGNRYLDTYVGDTVLSKYWREIGQ